MSARFDFVRDVLHISSLGRFVWSWPMLIKYQIHWHNSERGSAMLGYVFATSNYTAKLEVYRIGFAGAMSFTQFLLQMAHQFSFGEIL